MHALTTPKLMMKLTTVVFSRRPNPSVPIKGTTVRSSPTIPPTQALISISSANCTMLARIPSRSGSVAAVGGCIGATSGDRTAVCSSFQFDRIIDRRTSFIQLDDPYVVRRCRRDAGQQCVHERFLG